MYSIEITIRVSDVKVSQETKSLLHITMHTGKETIPTRLSPLLHYVTPVMTVSTIRKKRTASGDGNLSLHITLRMQHLWVLCVGCFTTDQRKFTFL